MAAIYDKDITSLLRVRDVSGSFTIARALETPVSTMIKKGAKPKSTLFEYPYKQRHTPTDAGVADGQDVADGDLINNEGNKTMLQARVQKGWVPYGVGDVAQEFVTEYGGVTDLLADNAADAMDLAKEKLEVMILKDADSRAETGNTSGTSMLTRGLTNWIRAANPGGSPDLPVPTMALSPSGNIVTGKATADLVTEDDFRGVMQSIATGSRRTGWTWDVFMSAAMKTTASNWTRTATVPAATTVPLRRFNAGMADGKLTLNVVAYESDFGTLRFHTHFSLPAAVHALILDMSTVSLRPGRPPRSGDLPFGGGTVKKLIDFIYGNQMDNPKANGKITT